MKENPKHTDHHFTKISEYKYNLIEVDKTKTDLEKVKSIYDYHKQKLDNMKHNLSLLENPTDHEFNSFNDQIRVLAAILGDLFKEIIEPNESVEPSKSYEELQKENEALKLTFQVLKTGLELFTSLKKVNDFSKGGIVNNSEGPEMVVDQKKRVKIVDFLKLDISTRLYNVIKFIDEEFEFIHEIDYRKWIHQRRFGKKTLNELIKISLEQNILLHKTIS